MVRFYDLAVHHAATVAAAEEGVTLSGLIEQATAEWLTARERGRRGDGVALVDGGLQTVLVEGPVTVGPAGQATVGAARVGGRF